MRLLSFLPHTMMVLATCLVTPLVFAQDVYSELELSYLAASSLDSKRQDDWHGLLGAGVIVLQQPVADKRGFVLPLVAATYKDTVFWHFSQLGVWILKSHDRRSRLALALKARRGYDPADYDALLGMDKRDTSIEAGISGVWLTRPVSIRYGYFSDISGNSHGDSAQLHLTHPFRVAPRWFLAPSVGAEWLSDEVVDYYFGVKPGEATLARPAYQGKASVNLRAGIAALYLLQKDWLLFGGVSVTHLGGGISDSPIVIHDDITALLLGGSWMF